MKLKFKEQQFQLDAVNAVVNCFEGQGNQKSTFTLERMDKNEDKQIAIEDINNIEENIGYKNKKVQINDDSIILKNIINVQKQNQIEASNKIELSSKRGIGSGYNLTVEMETGTGKTYTYIRTMYELYKKYGWSKFIIVVPSIAIREGVHKTFEITTDHFMEEYKTKIRYFVYNSKNLTNIENFASNSGISAMIINHQAFNARGNDARRIYMELDEFGSRRPIDVIAQTNPILIIDEPQSVEGKKTKEALSDFNPLMTLRYSATHKKGEEYNKVYRLDALDAYNKKLVKKIKVKGISVKGSTGTDGYVYLEAIELSKSAPKAVIEYEERTNNKIKRVRKKVTDGYNLYSYSGEMEQYKEGYTISEINGYNNTITFLNGITIGVGEAIGDVNEMTFRRIQIRETIKSHLEKEKELYKKGIKVLSLFFIDEVAKYRLYSEDGEELQGEYAKMFEEEYQQALNEFITLGNEDYNDYINSISVRDTHKGYFSIDKKSNRMINPVLKKKETESDDVSAYDLIMKDKERLLSFEEPTRFIFSHSALKEGWDNPNVFQICTLKHSDSDTKRRQEVGRGLRLCVNKHGERMDEDKVGEDVHKINVLTVIASESYESFVKALQSDIADTLTDRPKKADDEFFLNKIIVDDKGNESVLDSRKAKLIYKYFYKNDYIDDEDNLTEEYYNAVENNSVKVPDELEQYKQSIIDLVKTIYSKDNSIEIDNDRDDNIKNMEINQNFHKKEFQDLWNKINIKTYYEVDFDSEKLVKESITSIDNNLKVSQLMYNIVEGSLENTKDKESIKSDGFIMESEETKKTKTSANNNIRYDLVGEIVDKTNLTRKTVANILSGIRIDTFNMFKENPEDFILKVSKYINDTKARLIVADITYNTINETYDSKVFIDNKESGKLGDNVFEAKRHIYDYIKVDSTKEKELYEHLEASKEVNVYAKLPRSFKIDTPVGKYSPDWAIVFNEGEVKHIYFVAETKGSVDKKDLKGVEDAKIECAKKHFASISNGKVKYSAIASYENLIEIVK